MSTAAQPFHPQLFGKFFLLQKLAAGGMAEIYRAKSSGAGGFEKELALKRILPHLSSDKTFVRMLVNEAKLTVALTHPTIAQIYELGEIDGTFFISMEYVEGASLHDAMHRCRSAGRPLTIEQSIYLSLEVLRGLDYAHKKTDGAGNPLGVVHCDVSPDNVMLTWDGGVKLLDFGVARAAQGALSNYKEGSVMGKLNYVAPEQGRGEWFDHRVDLFAVGVMLYELLTGEHPFGRVKSIDELHAARKRKVVPPSKLKPELPSILDDFVVRSLAYSRDDRFPTAKEMADELVDFLFPTPTQAVAEHLSVMLREMYKERIEKQQRIRQNDALNIKVLGNARSAEQRPERSEARAGEKSPAEPGVAPSKTDNMRLFVSGLEPGATIAPEESWRDRIRQQNHARAPAYPLIRARLRRNLAIGLLLGCVIGIGAAFAYFMRLPPSLVVLSDPPGAQVLLRDQPLGVTPLLLESVEFAGETVTLELQLEGRRSTSVTVSRGGRLLQARATLPSAFGTLTIVSEPPGATITFDGVEVGKTPLELSEVTLGAMHRVDLARRGYDIDSSVVTPEHEAQTLTRTLTRSTK